MKRIALILMLLGVFSGAARAQKMVYGAMSDKTSLMWPLEKRGAKDENVHAAQFLLRSRGFRVAADGKLGFATENALRSFQKQRKIKVDGILGTQTWEKLVVPLRRGARGDAVRALQMLLSQNGAKVKIDGTFGAATERALRTMQKERGYGDSARAGRAELEEWGFLVGAEVEGC